MQVQEVIVTAEKRSTNLQRTPGAITALSPEVIAEHEVRDLKDIQAIVPNFKMGDAEGISQISIRGVGSSVFKPGSEGEVAVNENEVYIARGVAQQRGLFDVSGLEVLRGPQGTLYGQNTSAGHALWPERHSWRSEHHHNAPDGYLLGIRRGNRWQLR